MLKRKKIDPLVIGIIVTILVVSLLIFSGSVNAESKQASENNNHHGYDGYNQNICSHDEYGCGEYDEIDQINGDNDQV